MSSNLDHTHTGCLLILLCERPTVQATQPGLEKRVAKKLKITQVCQLVAKNVFLTGKARAMSSNLNHTHTGCLLMLFCERATVQRPI